MKIKLYPRNPELRRLELETARKPQLQFIRTSELLMRVAAGKSTARTGSSAGVYQPLDAELTAIAGLTSAADKVPYFTGSGTAALATLTSAGRALIDDASAAAQRVTLLPSMVGNTGKALTVNVGETDVEWTAGVGGGYAEIQEEGGALTSRTKLNFVGAGLTAADDAGNARTNVSVDETLNAFAALITAADLVPYFTGVDTMATASLTSFARTLLDDADADTARETIGAVSCGQLCAISNGYFTR